MGLSELCIRRPVMTTLMMLSLVVAGLLGYRQLPIAAIPKIDTPTITVAAALPGASPTIMAVSVAAQLEKQFATIAGVNAITSSSVEGLTTVTIEFDLNRNIDAAALDVQSAISIAIPRLPQDMPAPPGFLKVNPGDTPIIFLALTSDIATPQMINDYAETLISPRLSTLSGVAQVEIRGAQKQAVRIRYSLDALASRGVSIDELRTAVASQASVSPIGSIRTERQTYILETKGADPKADFFRDAVIAWRNGAPVRLRDVAKVEDSVENTESQSEFNHERSIIVSVQRQPDSNTVEVANAVKELVPQFNAALPPTIKLRIVNDRSISIRESVHDVQVTLMITAILVVIVILAFLRNWRATIIPALALPLSIIATFSGMALLGFSLDNVSLLALTLALGFVVDDAIVVLENIVRHIEEGMTPFEAAIKGSKEITFTIISITISLVAVFIPILFMGGVIGRFFNEFAVTVTLAILFSGFISLTLTPMLAARLLKKEQQQQSALSRWFESYYTMLANGYRTSLDASLRVPGLTWALTIGSLVATLVMFATAKKGFLPTEDPSEVRNWLGVLASRLER